MSKMFNVTVLLYDKDSGAMASNTWEFSREMFSLIEPAKGS